MKQIICLSHLPWQARPTRTQQLFARMGDAQILFFEPAPPRGAPMPEQGRRVRAHITVYTLPAHTAPAGPELRRRRALARCADFIQETARRHRFRSPVLWCTAPEQGPLARRVEHGGLVYDCAREWGEEFLADESDLAARADVTFAASPGLAEWLSPCGDNIALLPNGVNPLMFSRGEFSPPEALAGLAGQTVFGRLGDLDSRTDLSPLITAALRRSEWTFLLLGRVTKPAAKALAPCPNVILAGPVSAVEVPDCLSVCTALFDLNRADRMGSDIVPAHIYEYLATGLPIVAMAAPDGPEPFPDLVYTAYDGTGFLRRCQAALKEDRAALAPQRKELAAQSAWSLRAAEVERILESTGLF